MGRAARPLDGVGMGMLLALASPIAPPLTPTRTPYTPAPPLPPPRFLSLPLPLTPQLTAAMEMLRDAGGGGGFDDAGMLIDDALPLGFDERDADVGYGGEGG